MLYMYCEHVVELIINICTKSCQSLSQFFVSFIFFVGVAELETICQFGCLSLVTHYVIFMTFFPACLSLFLEVGFLHRKYWTQSNFLVQTENIGKAVITMYLLVVLLSSAVLWKRPRLSEVAVRNHRHPSRGTGT